jgi:hypothetical protein
LFAAIRSIQRNPGNHGSSNGVQRTAACRVCVAPIESDIGRDDLRCGGGVCQKIRRTRFTLSLADSSHRKRFVRP